MTNMNGHVQVNLEHIYNYNIMAIAENGKYCRCTTN
jgi:predicted  nucleic acid-binding Zn-ribbon protein